MRVLLSTIGSRGDVQPLVALALELRARPWPDPADRAKPCSRPAPGSCRSIRAPQDLSRLMVQTTLERTLEPEVAARAQSAATAVRSDGAQAAARRLITGARAKMS